MTASGRRGYGRGQAPSPSVHARGRLRVSPASGLSPSAGPFSPLSRGVSFARSWVPERFRGGIAPSAPDSSGLSRARSATTDQGYRVAPYPQIKWGSTHATGASPRRQLVVVLHDLATVGPLRGELVDGAAD